MVTSDPGRREAVARDHPGAELLDVRGRHLGRPVAVRPGGGGGAQPGARRPGRAVAARGAAGGGGQAPGREHGRRRPAGGGRAGDRRAAGRLPQPALGQRLPGRARAGAVDRSAGAPRGALGALAPRGPGPAVARVGRRRRRRRAAVGPWQPHDRPGAGALRAASERVRPPRARARGSPRGRRHLRPAGLRRRTGGPAVDEPGGGRAGAALPGHGPGRAAGIARAGPPGGPPAWRPGAGGHAAHGHRGRR